jgi:hypothetical protein
MRGPSAQTLQKYFPDCDAKRVKRIMTGAESPLTVAQTETWYRQCYHPPSDRELRRHAIDVLIGGHGLEAIHGRSGKVVAEYSNQGDTYAPTLMFRNGHCWVNNWGDFVESYERRHGKLN